MIDITHWRKFTLSGPFFEVLDGANTVLSRRNHWQSGEYTSIDSRSTYMNGGHIENEYHQCSPMEDIDATKVGANLWLSSYMTLFLNIADIRDINGIIQHAWASCRVFYLPVRRFQLVKCLCMTSSFSLPHFLYNWKVRMRAASDTSHVIYYGELSLFWFVS